MLRLRRLDSLDRQAGNLLEPASDEAIATEERDAVDRAVRKLTAEQREVVHMRIYEDMAFQQIADELDVSINTVASRYRYAMHRLRQLLASLKEDQRS
jgi:RNA polymerase sigma-70 factor (ECF subfamily)